MSLHEEQDEGYNSHDEKEEEEVEERVYTGRWRKEKVSEDEGIGEGIDVISILCNPTLARSISVLAKLVLE